MASANKTIITCAVTGAGAYTDRMRAVPVSPAEIAAECVAAARAGAAACHIHVRDPVTRGPSMELDLYRQVVRILRDGDVDMLVNLTTGAGARYIPDPEKPQVAAPGSTLTAPEARVAHVVALSPEICSLDVATMNFGQHAIINTPTHLTRMASLIRAAGTLPELEVFDVGQIMHARRMIEQGLIDEPPFFQLCLGVAGGAPATAEAMVALRSFVPPGANWGGFGIAAASFPMVAQCVLLGGHVRVGLEDNLYVERGRLATGNAELVDKAVAIVRTLGGDVASPAEAREILGIASRTPSIGEAADALRV